MRRVGGAKSGAKSLLGAGEPAGPSSLGGEVGIKFPHQAINSTTNPRTRGTATDSSLPPQTGLYSHITSRHSHQPLHAHDVHAARHVAQGVVRGARVAPYAHPQTCCSQKYGRTKEQCAFFRRVSRVAHPRYADTTCRARHRRRGERNRSHARRAGGEQNRRRG